MTTFEEKAAQTLAEMNRVLAELEAAKKILREREAKSLAELEAAKKILREREAESNA